MFLNQFRGRVKNTDIPGKVSYMGLISIIKRICEVFETFIHEITIAFSYDDGIEFIFREKGLFSF